MVDRLVEESHFVLPLLLVCAEGKTRKDETRNNETIM